jgi:hypothetical protein
MSIKNFNRLGLIISGLLTSVICHTQVPAKTVTGEIKGVINGLIINNKLLRV